MIYMSDEIELEGKDVDRLDINDIRIMLPWISTSELWKEGYQEVKKFVKDLFTDKKRWSWYWWWSGRGDRYRREIGVEYCDYINVNKALLENSFFQNLYSVLWYFWIQKWEIGSIILLISLCVLILLWSRWITKSPIMLF